jgi:hypothetical protein
LVNEDKRYNEDKIKKRGQNNSYTYQRKYRGNKNEQGEFLQEIRKPLTSLQYVMLREQQADSKYVPVNRQRINFVYSNLSYAIDVYDNVLGQEKVYLLRFATNKGETKDLVPPFI